MSPDVIAIIVAVALGVIALLVFLNRKFQQLSANNGQRASEDIRTLHERLDRQAQLWSEHLQSISRQFGTVSELGRQMRDFQDFLRSPKVRGTVGEQVLKDIIEQALPKSAYAFQYRFKDGQQVDAIIRTDKGIIPVDAKFPLENFRALQRAATDAEQQTARKEFTRDVKKHIEAISAKYIQPAEGTLEYAIMYVPSETVYYEIIRDDSDLNNYANDRHVTMASPNTFHFIVSVFLATLRGQEIAKAAKDMQQFLGQLAVDVKKFGGQLELASKHVTNAKTAIDGATTQFSRLENRLEDVKRLKAGREDSA